MNKEKKPLQMEKQNENELQDLSFKIVELREGIETSLANMEKIIKQQKILIKIVEDSNEKEEFLNNFVKECLQQNEEFNSQINILSKRLVIAKELEEKMNKNEENKQLINLILNVLGVK